MIEYQEQHYPDIPDGGRRCVVPLPAMSGAIPLACGRLPEEHYEQTLLPPPGSEPCDRFSCRHPLSAHDVPKNPRLYRARCTVNGGPDRRGGCPCGDYIYEPRNWAPVTRDLRAVMA